MPLQNTEHLVEEDVLPKYYEFAQPYIQYSFYPYIMFLYKDLSFVMGTVIQRLT
jgi:hypothetical protein